MLGGIRPRFSAYMINSDESLRSEVAIALLTPLAVNPNFDIIVFPSKTTVTVSPSTSPLSYKLILKLSDLKATVWMISVFRFISSAAGTTSTAFTTCFSFCPIWVTGSLFFSAVMSFDFTLGALVDSFTLMPVETVCSSFFFIGCVKESRFSKSISRSFEVNLVCANGFLLCR